MTEGDDGSEKIEFVGTLQSEENLGVFSEVSGWFRWLEPDGPMARISGEILVDRGVRFNLFFNLGVSTLRGRTSRLAIPGVGLSPVRIYSDGKPNADGKTIVVFEAWGGPVPIASATELADTLRMPIADALEQSGLRELAALARSAAVALGGFTPPPPRGLKK